MNWAEIPTWLQAAILVFVGAEQLLAISAVTWVFRRPRRAPVEHGLVQIRKAVEDAANDAEDRATSAGKEADGRTAEVVSALEDIRELLTSLDETISKAVER